MLSVEITQDKEYVREQMRDPKLREACTGGACAPTDEAVERALSLPQALVRVRKDGADVGFVAFVAEHGSVCFHSCLKLLGDEAREAAKRAISLVREFYKGPVHAYLFGGHTKALRFARDIGFQPAFSSPSGDTVFFLTGGHK